MLMMTDVITPPLSSSLHHTPPHSTTAKIRPPPHSTTAKIMPPPPQKSCLHHTPPPHSTTAKIMPPPPQKSCLHHRKNHATTTLHHRKNHASTTLHHLHRRKNPGRTVPTILLRYHIADYAEKF